MIELDRPYHGMGQEHFLFRCIFFELAVLFAIMKKKARNHDRAAGKAQTSISLREDLLLAAKAAAEADSRSLSSWLEVLLKERLGTIPPQK